MGPCFHHRRRARGLPLLVAVAVAALFSATAGRAGAQAPNPCPSCPNVMPGGGGSGSAPGSGTGAGGGSGPAAVPAAPLVSLAPITIVDGIASVTGTVHADASVGASVAADVRVSVNGSPIAVSARGTFSASTNVAANGGITVEAGELSAGITYSISIPASAIPSNGVRADALVQLRSDAVTLMLPPDGFTIVDGVGIEASVHVAHIDGIVRLSLNGTNLLARLRAGSSSGSSSSGTAGSARPGTKPAPGKVAGKARPASHTATAHVSGSAKSVKLTVTASNGASQTTSVRIERISSVVRIGRQLTISAFGARGIRIAKVAFNRNSVHTTGRLGIVVTVVDRRNYLVRDAVVMLQPYAHRPTVAGSSAQMSDFLGRAKFSVALASKALGHRLYVTVSARTPLSKARVTASTRLAACGC